MKPFRLASALLLAAAAPLAAQQSATAPTPAQQADWRETWAYNLGMQAVVYGYPVVKNIIVRYGMIEKPVGQANMPISTWFHSRRAQDHTDKLHSSVTSDLLYSAAWYDLHKEPLVLSVPDDGGAYYSIQFMEMYSDIFAYIGTRETGGKAGSWLLVGPDWKGEAPAGISGVIRSPTPTGMLLLRVGFADRAQLKATHALQDANALAPLSKWLSGDKSPETGRDVINPAAPGSSVLPFFASLNRGLTENPPPAAHAALMAQFATVGIGPGMGDDFSTLDPATLKGLQRAMVDGLGFLRQVSVAGGNTKIVNHWAYGQPNWGRTAQTNDFLTRSANQSFSGMQEHWVDEVTKLRAHHDGDGALLDGSAARYTVHFTREQIPQAKAFWSVTVYNSEYDLVENPLGRFSLGSVDKALKYDRDGGLTFYLQADAPAKKLMANWLPVPRGPFNLFLRAYLPGQSLIEQSYAPPIVKRVP
ncbi:MAG: DUF1254 domain-containing protein [Novosphingobium sp.]|uniref:DUF1254 domain-containing protein n=1 Tax=Novosphingobium sp. TaxID=1874826 RepID=UPI0032BBFBDA